MLPIAVDAMGGDNAPGEIVAGAIRARDELNVPILLVGRPAEIGDTDGIEVLEASEVIAMDADPIAAVARRLRQGPPLGNLPIDLPLAPFRLVGQLDRRWPNAIVQAQYGQVQPKHLLSAWIRHLVLCVAGPGDQTRESVLVGRPGKPGGAKICRLQPVDDARSRLEDLAGLYLAGQQQPLLLFPKASHAFVEALRRDKGVAEARIVARGVWEGRGSAERNDPHLARIFGDQDPLHEDFALLTPPLAGGDFASLARRVFGPLLDHLREGE